jgi:hypothetical protein
MDSANEMREQISRAFEQDNLEAVYPSFYKALPEEEGDDSDGLIVNCTIVDWNFLCHISETKQRIEDTLHRLYHITSCSHVFDCCGCWFTSRVKIDIAEVKNIYGKNSPCYEVTATFGYGRNV